MKAVKLNTQPKHAESTQGKVGHHNDTRSGVRKSQEPCAVPVSEPQVNNGGRERNVRKFAALAALLAAFLASVVPPAARPFISFSHDATFPIHSVRTRLRMTCRCSCRSHSASSSCRARRHSPGPLAQIRRQPSFAMISSFSIISSSFLGPVRNSRLMSFGIISLTTNIYAVPHQSFFKLVLVLSHLQ